MMTRQVFHRGMTTDIFNHLLPKDAESKKKRIGLLHATVVTLSLLILLLTILTTQEPYRYTKSFLAFQKGVHLADLQSDSDINMNDVWVWIDNLADEIGGETVEEITLNCQYDDWPSQSVRVDGTNYDMVYPYKSEDACSQKDLQFIGGQDDPLYLIGSHQILAFGIFTKRSNTHFPIKKSVATSEMIIEVNSDKDVPLNPYKDNKVIEVCSVSVPIPAPTVAPTRSPTAVPSLRPSASPSRSPSAAPSSEPSRRPTVTPTLSPTVTPSNIPSSIPTQSPVTSLPTASGATNEPTVQPTARPTVIPTRSPTYTPTVTPTAVPPSAIPTPAPTITPTTTPTNVPIVKPKPTGEPTGQPTGRPSLKVPPAKRRALQGPPPTSGGGGTAATSIEYKCVSKDGFAVEGAPYTPGATMNWPGQLIRNSQDGKEYRAYNSSRARASFFEDGTKSFATYVPCFIMGSNGSVESGISQFDGTADELARNLTKCSNTWVSKGRQFRTQCLREQNTGPQATAHQAYLAGFNNIETVPLMYEHFFGCESLFFWSATDLDNVFVEAHRPIDSYLEYDQSYGMFFPTQSEKSWAEDAIIGKMTLKMHGFLDQQTTTATTYIVTRNLDEDALFYALVKVTFSFRVSGQTSIQFETIFSPMIQYNYGTGDYDFKHRQMYVWEVVFLVIFSLFALREIYQLVFLRVVPFLRKRLAPAVIMPAQENKTDGMVIKERQMPTVEENYEMPKLKADCEEMQEIENIEEQAKPTIDLNHDGKDDIMQIKHFIIEKNLETEALMEKMKHDIEEIMPDSAGMLDILDWLTIAIIAISIYFRVEYVRRASDLHELFVFLSETHAYDQYMTEIINDFESIRVNSSIMYYLVLCLIIVGMFQFFRYLSFDKRLGIVTATVKDSLEHLFPVLVIFIVVIFSYAILGTVMYGEQLNEWSNVTKSISQLCLMLLGEIPAYYGIMEVDPFLSSIFFWSYIIIALFLLFNMIMAVIFLVYDQKEVEFFDKDDDPKESKKEK